LREVWESHNKSKKKTPWLVWEQEEVRPGQGAAKEQPGKKRRQSVKKVREGTHSWRGQRMGGRWGDNVDRK